MKSLRQQICDILATGCFTVVDVADSLGVQSRDGVKKIYDAIWLLAKEGRVAAAPDTKPEVWHLIDPKISVQDRLWRACILKSQKGSFAVADLVPIVQGKRSAAVSRDYAQRYVRWLWDAAYLRAVGRGRDGEWVYLVIPGREREPAPHWNRRAEKRKSSGQGSGASGQGDCKDWNPLAGCMGTPQTCPGPCPHMEEEQKPVASPPLPKGGEASPQERLDAALKGFFHLIVEIAGSCDRAIEIIQEMKTTLLAVQEIAHGEPEGHH